MTEKIRLRDTSWGIKIGVIGGWTIIGIYSIYLLIGFIQGLLA